MDETLMTLAWPAAASLSWGTSVSCTSAPPADLEEVGEQEVGEVVGLGD